MYPTHSLLLIFDEFSDCLQQFLFNNYKILIEIYIADSTNDLTGRTKLCVAGIFFRVRLNIVQALITITFFAPIQFMCFYGPASYFDSSAAGDSAG